MFSKWIYCAAVLLATATQGCLLAADPPALTDLCVNGELESLLGEAIVSGHVVESDDTFECSTTSTYGSAEPDLVYSWTAPKRGLYRFSVDSVDGSPRVGLAAPVCGGKTFVCADSGYSTSARVDALLDAGEEVAIVVEDADIYDSSRTETSARLELSIARIEEGTPAEDDIDPDTEPCPWEGDGQCDEPEGLDLCEEGSDPLDCD